MRMRMLESMRVSALTLALMVLCAGAAMAQPLEACDPIDPDYCGFPFPNDYYTRADDSSPTGLRVALPGDAMPSNFVGMRVIPAKWNVLDGFSVGPMMLTVAPGVDLERSGAPVQTDIARSLDRDASILLIDAETGAPQLMWVERDVGGIFSSEQPLILRVGKNLPNGRRFIVAMRNLVDAAGEPIEANPVFAAYRDGAPQASPEREARREHMEDIFAVLAEAGIARHDLFLAWDFTVQSTEGVARKLLHMRDDAFDILGDEAPAFRVTSVEEPLDDRTFRRINGTFDVPLYMEGGGGPGTLLRLGPDGLPFNEGDVFTARFRCIIPWAATTEGAAPAVPARPSLYGHGLLGSESEVSAGNVRDMAAEHNFVFCGTQMSGMADEDTPTAFEIITDFTQFPKFSERLHHGLLNSLFLGRLMIHPDGLASDPAFQVGGESVIDRRQLFYDGNSQGAISGGALAAIAQDFDRAVLGVPGANYSTLLRRSVDFDSFNTFFEAAYTNGFDRVFLISMAEMLWEQAEINGHLNHLTRDTYPDTPPKKILFHMAFGDHQTANVSVEVAARSMGARIHQPALSPDKGVPEVEPYFGIAPIHPSGNGRAVGWERRGGLPAQAEGGRAVGARGFQARGFDGSALVVWDSGNPPPPAANTPPRIEPTDPEWEQLFPCAQNFGGDPHECPRRQPAARLQKSLFLQTGGSVVDVCDGGPCLAP